MGQVDGFAVIVKLKEIKNRKSNGIFVTRYIFERTISILTRSLFKT
jgi:hypothetical protein